MEINSEFGMGIVMEWVKSLEGVLAIYKEVMEINWDLGMEKVVKLVRFLENYKQEMETN